MFNSQLMKCNNNNICSVFCTAFGSKKPRQSDQRGQDQNQTRRAFKIGRMKCKWRRKKRNNSKQEHDENSERSEPLASRLTALFSSRKKKKKVGTNDDEDNNNNSQTGYQRVEFNRKSASVNEEEGLELCKKRILMGERCRTLNPSGSLHYDHNGILLPEFLPCE